VYSFQVEEVLRPERQVSKRQVRIPPGIMRGEVMRPRAARMACGGAYVAARPPFSKYRHAGARTVPRYDEMPPGFATMLR